jgi:acyl-CoA thioesterase FadM
VKIEHAYEVLVVEREGKPADIQAFAGATTLACVDRDGRPRELPDWLATR